jgi:hypothetical protein
MSAKPTPLRVALPDHIGGTATVSNGCIQFEGARIGRVGISNLAEVVDHTIVSIVGSVAHHIRFVNGGELHYAFNSRSELVDLEARAISGTVTRDGTYLFGAYRSQL